MKIIQGAEGLSAALQRVHFGPVRVLSKEEGEVQLKGGA